jgi:hypothetical protein
MKRTLVVLAVAVTLLLAFGTVAVALAQGPNGDADTHSCPMAGGDAARVGVLHDDMMAALATRLGLPSEDLQSRVTGGETVWQIARAQGLSDEQITTLMRDAMQDALKAAVASGDITQEQADRMGRMGRFMGHMTGRNGAGRGAGMGRGLGHSGLRTGESA